MSHRLFHDEQGRSWEVWAVFPEVVERRLNEERRATPREAPDRRQRVDIRFRMAPELRHGWLAFQSGYERRRLAPIPSGWEDLTDEALGELARSAIPQPAAGADQRDGAPSTGAPPRADRPLTDRR